MVTAADLGNLALVPVRGTVYVVKLPFVLVWMVLGYICALVYGVIARVLSIPANYVRRAARRIRLTWNWTKSSAKSFLPWQSNVPARVQPVRCLERDDLEDLLYGGDHRLALRRPHRRGGRRRRRAAIISALIRILMEPASPVESEEECEISRSDDEGEEVYRLIRDLIQFSRSDSQTPVPPQTATGECLDLETLRRHARDREKLQALITDLDQYVKEMDSGSQPKAGGARRRREPSDPPVSHTAAGLDDREHLLTPDTATVSSNGDTDLYQDASEGEGHLSGEESESDYGEQYDDANSGLSPQVVCRGLSPVVEVSPEVVSIGSAESLEGEVSAGVEDLESELNSAMSKLTVLTSELDQVSVEESVLESRQTKYTETVTIASVPEARPQVTADARKDSPSEDGFAGIPKTSPSLGLEAGHSRRNLATARKIRPPSQTKECQQPPSDGVGDSGATPLGLQHSKEFEEDSSGEEGDPEEEEEGSPRAIPGAVQVLPQPTPLSDQLKLLTPKRRGTDPMTSPPEVSDLYSTVNKRSGKPSRAKSVGDGCATPEHQSDLSRTRSDSTTITTTTGSGSPASAKVSVTPERSLFIADVTPPWMQMRARNNSSTSSTSSSPAHALDGTPPPPLPRRSNSLTLPLATHTATPEDHGAVPLPQVSHTPSAKSDLYDQLPKILPAPPIPSRAGEEGLYDVIPCHQQRGQYLHERLVASDRREPTRATPPISWTPQLPPRNAMLKRTSSAEAMGTLPRKEQVVLVRRGSERRASTSSTHETRSRSESSSSSSAKRHRSTSAERDQERRVRRDRPSSEKQHHRSHRSGERSGERHSSSERHRSSSEKHRSSEKKASSSSSKSKHPPESTGGSLWKILSPSISSKTKASSSSSKKPEKEKERRKSSEKEERDRKKGDREKRHSSSRSRSEGTRHESSRTRTRTVAQEEEEMPRNESSSSLRSGVSTLSSDSSGRESLV